MKGIGLFSLSEVGGGKRNSRGRFLVCGGEHNTRNVEALKKTVIGHREKLLNPGGTQLKSSDKNASTLQVLEYVLVESYMRVLHEYKHLCLRISMMACKWSA